MLKKRYRVLFLFDGSYRKGMCDPDALGLLVKQAAQKLGENIEVFVSYARSLSYLITNEYSKIYDHKNELDLADYDFVYFRKASLSMQQMLTCALYLKDNNVPFFDKEISLITSRNKLSQMYMMRQNSLPIPNTLFTRSSSRTVKLIEMYSDFFQYPLIAKASGGARGDANYLVKDSSQLVDLFKKEKRHFIIQEFIPNDGDFRFFVVGGLLGGVIRRRAVNGSHLNNVSKGGTAEIISKDNFSKRVFVDALTAASIFSRDCAGVDVIFNKNTGKHFLLEVNRSPQIENAAYEDEKSKWLVKAVVRSIENYQHVNCNNKHKMFGRYEMVQICSSDGSLVDIIAKIDTGATNSSIHTESIGVINGVLQCKIAGIKMSFNEYTEKDIKSSNGSIQRRFVVSLPLSIGGEKFIMKVSLSNRIDMNYEMLIGKRFLKANDILVDVNKRHIAKVVKKGGQK